MSELTVNTDVGATLYDAPREVTPEQKAAFLAKVKGAPCQTCGAEKETGEGLLCRYCRERRESAISLVHVLAGQWNGDGDERGDQQLLNAIGREMRYYREDIAKRKARVEEERNG